MTTQSEYFKNVIGLTNLAGWLSRWYQFEKSFKITESSIFIDGLISGRFVLGIPKNKNFGNNIFLAIQPEEMLWFKHISWSHFCVDLENNRLHIVSKRIYGMNDKTPDFPAFSIAILFDVVDKLQFVERQNFLDVRELWYEDEGKIEHISRSSSVNSLKVKILKPGESILKQEDFAVNANKDYDSIMASKLNSYQNVPKK